jgi:glutamate-ammonia-ligase adenylyltransferase
VKLAAVKDKLEKVATRIVSQLSTVEEGGRLYDVDARLRPEGKSAPLVVDRKAYLTYLSHRASLWERQSLTRLRFIAGDENLAKKVLADVEAFVYESSLPKNWVEDIVAMRKKTETRSKISGVDFVDVKLSSGGMVDVEFLAQMLQLKFGATERSMRNLSTMSAIRSSSVSIPKGELVDAYQLYRRIETLLRIAFEERGNILPEKEKLDLLTKLFGFSDGRELRGHVLSTLKSTRQTFLKTAEQLA